MSSSLKYNQRVRGKSFKVDVVIDESTWSDLTVRLNGLSKNIRGAAIVGEIEAATKFKSRLKQDIKSGGSRFGFIPNHNSKYGTKKMRAGKGDTPMNLTGSYYRSIKVQWSGHKNVTVGVDPKAIAPKIEGFGNKNNRRVGWYVKIVEAKYPIMRLSFKAWGGKNKIKKIVTRVTSIGIKYYMRTGNPVSVKMR